MIPSEIIQAAQWAQRKWTIPAAVSIGQYGLESAWGSKEPPGSLNGFGIKAVAGMPYVLARTREEHPDGSSYYIVAPFEKFASVAEAFDAHAKLLATAPIYAEARSKLPDIQAFVEAMAVHYATAHDYASQLLSLIIADHLLQFDVLPVAPTVVLVQPSPVPAPQPASSQTSIGAIGQPPVAPPPPGQMSQPDFTPSQIALPSQVAAFVQQFGTHLGAVAGGALVSWGAIQPGQEAQFSAIAGGIAVWGVSLLINYIAQTLRHRQAQTAVAVALATPPIKVS